VAGITNHSILLYFPLYQLINKSMAYFLDAHQVLRQ